MELNRIKNRVFPTLREDVNWCLLLDEICLNCDKTLFHYLRQNEIPEQAILEISEFSSAILSSKPQAALDVLSINGYKNITFNGKIVKSNFNTIIYNDKYDKFEESDEEISRGTYVLVLNRKGEYVDDILIDTYSPSSLGFSLDLVFRAGRIISKFISEYKDTDNILVLMSLGKSSITSDIVEVLSQINVDAKEDIQRESLEFIVVDLKNYLDGYYKCEDNLSLPIKDKLLIGDLDNLLDVELFTATLQTEEDKEFDKVYGLSVPTENRPLLIAGADVNGIQSKVLQVVGIYNEFVPTAVKVAILTQDKLYEASNEQAALLGASALNGIFVYVFENNSNKVVLAVTEFDISSGIIPEGSYFVGGATSSSFSKEVNILQAGTKIYATYNKLRLSNSNYSPNAFIGEYEKLFGNKAFDLYSLWSLYQANSLLGGTVADINLEFDEEESSQKYFIRGLSFVDINDDGGTGYSPVELLPSKGRKVGDVISGELNYSYLAKIHDTDKLVEIKAKHDVRLIVTSYNKGMFTFDASEEDIEFLRSLLSRELVGHISATVVRNVSGFNNGRFLKGIKVSGDKEQLLKEWLFRSIPITKLAGIINWTLIISKQKIQATKTGVIDAFSVINVWGNDGFSIDTRHFPNWYNIIVEDGTVDENKVWHAIAPTTIRSIFAVNDTAKLREFDMGVIGDHGSNYTIKVIQSSKDTVNPVVIYSGVPHEIKPGESQKIIESKSGFICSIEIISQLGGTLVADEWITLSATEGPFTEPITVSIGAFETDEEVYRKGSVSLIMDGGIEYPNFIQITQKIELDLLKSELIIQANSSGGTTVWYDNPRIESRDDLIWIMAASKLVKQVNHPFITPLYVPQWPATITTVDEYQDLKPDLPDFLEGDVPIVGLDDSAKLNVEIKDYDKKAGVVNLEFRELKGIYKFEVSDSSENTIGFRDEFFYISWADKKGFHGVVDNSLEFEFLDLDNTAFTLNGGIITEENNTGLEVEFFPPNSGMLYLALAYLVDASMEASPDVLIRAVSPEGDIINLFDGVVHIEKEGEKFKVISVNFDNSKYSKLIVSTQDDNLVLSGATFVSTSYDEGVMCLPEWEDRYVEVNNGYIGQEFRIRVIENLNYRLKEGYPLVYTDNTQVDNIDYTNNFNKVIRENTAGASIISWLELNPNLEMHWVSLDNKVQTAEISQDNTLQTLQLKFSVPFECLLEFKISKFGDGTFTYKFDSNNWIVCRNSLNVKTTVYGGIHTLEFRYERDFGESEGSAVIEQIKFFAETGKRRLREIKRENGWHYYSLPEENDVFVEAAFTLGVPDPRNLLEFPRPLNKQSDSWPWSTFDNFCKQNQSYRTSEYAIIGRGSSVLSAGYESLFLNSSDNTNDVGVVIVTIPINSEDKKLIADELIPIGSKAKFLQEGSTNNVLDELKSWEYKIEESKDSINFHYIPETL